MEKSNFKKMALMGMAGGLLLASQSPMSVDNIGTTGTYLAGGCGGNGSCGGYKGGATDNLPGYFHQSSNNAQKRNSCASKRGYTADASTDVKAQATQTTTTTTTTSSASTKPITETELLSQLNEQGKTIYQGLSPEGKALALTIANQGTTKDKNEAVKLAAQKIAEKRNGAAATKPASY